MAAALGAFLPSVALADVWTDIRDATWQTAYGVSAQDALAVAQGRADGSFGPKERVNRGQFAKMATGGLAIMANLPATSSFTDISAGDAFYREVEVCTSAGVMSGYADGTFHPESRVTREQTCSVLGRWLAGQEIDIKGGIVGAQSTYGSLAAWYAAEGRRYLDVFADGGSISPAHRVATAYLVYRGVVIGNTSGGSTQLYPTSSINRAQAVVLVLRAKGAAASFTPPPATPDEPETPIDPSVPTTAVLSNGQTPLRGVWAGTADRLASYLLSVAPSPRFTIPTQDLATLYVRYCGEAGLRADLLWAQMILETGYGMYGGDVSPEQNNYAGIGATGGGAPGYSFATPEAGVMAQVAHMVAYCYTTSPVAWANSTTDPRYDLVSPHGFASVLSDLNGRWAVPGTDYGQHIEAIARLINQQ